MQLKIWDQDKYVAYIYEDSGERSTIVINENDEQGSKSAYITKIVVSNAVDALLNRFNHIRPCQSDYETLVCELRMFLLAPDVYQILPKHELHKEALRFLKWTESTAELTPIKDKE